MLHQAAALYLPWCYGRHLCSRRRVGGSTAGGLCPCTSRGALYDPHLGSRRSAQARKAEGGR